MFGKETHVGNPLEGLSSNFILSYITQSIEYNARFKEKFEHETTPLPLSIANKDIKRIMTCKRHLDHMLYTICFYFNKHRRHYTKRF